MDPFLMTLAPAAAIYLIARPFRMRVLRRSLDAHSSASTDLRRAVRIAGIGTHAPAGGLHAERHCASIGTRILSSAVVLVILYLIHGPGAGDGDLVTPSLKLLSLLAPWYPFFIWRYEVLVDGPELRVTSLRDGTVRRDLRGLIAVEGDGGYMLRLYFRDQPRAEIIATVADAAGLRAKLNAHLPENARALTRAA